MGVALLLSGCAYSMGEYSVADRTPAVTDDSLVPAASTGLLEDQTAVTKPGAAVASAAVSQAPGYPNLNAPQDEASHLLSPEEKAAVIAELEALASRQARGMSTR